MSGVEIQQGVALMAGALLLVALTTFVTKHLGHPLGDRDPHFGAHGGGSKPVLQTLTGAYRVGVALQLVAFAGFVFW
jgi:hypothetical protein